MDAPFRGCLAGDMKFTSHIQIFDNSNQTNGTSSRTNFI